MLKFKDLTPANWKKYKKNIMSSELLFNESLRNSIEEYSTIVSRESSVCKIALLGSEYIGNIIGFCPTIEDIIKEELKGVKEDSWMVYLFNFVIDSEYQEHGYGSSLVYEFLKSAKKQGYKRLLGHFRQNSSLHIIKKIGAKEKKIYKNWYKSRENYVLCELMF